MSSPPRRRSTWRLLNRPRRPPRGRARSPRGRPAPDRDAPGLPVRVLPQSIELIERYFYDLVMEEPPRPGATSTRAPQGEINVMLPFDRSQPDLLEDVERHLRRQRGTLTLRVGWVGLSRLTESDIAARLAAVRPWSEPSYTAFPLVFEAIRAEDGTAQDLVGRGAFGFERLVYRPRGVRPYPLSLRLFVAHDSNAPLDALPASADGLASLPRPESNSSLEWVLHGQLGVKVIRPKGVLDEHFTMRIKRLEIEWPVPILSDQLRWLAPEAGPLYIDSRNNRLVVEDIPVRFDPSAGGLVEGACTFSLAIRRPALLPPAPVFKGRIVVEVGGFLLTELYARFFDAAGYLREQNGAGVPIVVMQNELHLGWEYQLAAPTRLAPHLLERRYRWRGHATMAGLSKEIEAALLDRGYVLNEAQSADYKEGSRWWAERQVAGHPVTVDMRLKHEEQSADPVSSPSTTIRLYDLQIRAHYRGLWALLAEEVDRLEALLRPHLQQRLRAHLS